MKKDENERKEKMKEYTKKYYEKNKDKIKEQAKKYRKEHKTELLIKRREYAKQNKEMYTNASKKWRNKNKEELKKKRINYRITNPIKMWATQSLGKHKTYGYDVQISHADLCEIAQNTQTCGYCDSTLIYTRYTKKTMSETPTTDRIDNEKTMAKNNVRIICQRCNRTKLDRTHDEFIEYCKKMVKKFDQSTTDNSHVKYTWTT